MSGRSHQGCLRLAATACTAACTAFILLAAAWSSTLPSRTVRLATSMPATPSLQTARPFWCAYGTLPATWVSSNPQPGTHWSVLDPLCQLQPLLSAFSDLPSTSAGMNADSANGGHVDTPTPVSSEDLDITILDEDSDAGPETQPEGMQQAAAGKSASDLSARILFVSDSVDRHVLTYLCEHIGGTVKATVLKDALPLMGQSALNATTATGSRALAAGVAAAGAAKTAAEGHTARDADARAVAVTAGKSAGDTSAADGEAADAASSATFRQVARRRNTAVNGRRLGKRSLGYGSRRVARPRPGAPIGAGTVSYFAVDNVPQTTRHLTARDDESGISSGEAQPSDPAPASAAASATPATAEPPSGYVVNTCATPSGRLRLLATYIPGVHPSGPFHKQRTLPYTRRIDHAAAVWRTYSSSPPDMIVVASLLWDLARASAYDAGSVSGPELPRSFLDSWAANYTRAVEYAQAVLPKAKLYVYHTAAAPRHSPSTGVMDKSYLGQANHVRQLNAVGKHVAQQLNMEVIDYAQVASRFQEGQSYLVDQIHPGREVGLELANIYLNYAKQLQL